jgi:CBS domain-containing protein
MRDAAEGSSPTVTTLATDPWHRQVRAFPGLVHLAPPINHPEDPLPQVIDAFARDQGAGAIFVVDHADKLLGCIPERAIDSDLLTLVLPQRLWPVVHEMDTRSVLRAARGAQRQARDVMVHVRSVTPESRLIDAVALMIRSEHPTLALVDASGRLLGYLRLFEVLAHFLRRAS